MNRADVEIVLVDIDDRIAADEELERAMKEIAFTRKDDYFQGNTEKGAEDFEDYIRTNLFPKLRKSSRQTVHVRNMNKLY